MKKSWIYIACVIMLVASGLIILHRYEQSERADYKAAKEVEARGIKARLEIERLYNQQSALFPNQFDVVYRNKATAKYPVFRCENGNCQGMMGQYSGNFWRELVYTENVLHDLGVELSLDGFHPQYGQLVLEKEDKAEQIYVFLEMTGTQDIWHVFCRENAHGEFRKYTAPLSAAPSAFLLQDVLYRDEHFYFFGTGDEDFVVYDWFQDKDTRTLLSEHILIDPISGLGKVWHLDDGEFIISSQEKALDFKLYNFFTKEVREQFSLAGIKGIVPESLDFCQVNKQRYGVYHKEGGVGVFSLSEEGKVGKAEILRDDEYQYLKHISSHKDGLFISLQKEEEGAKVYMYLPEEKKFYPYIEVVAENQDMDSEILVFERMNFPYK